MKVVITVVGIDRTGIIATVSQVMAEYGVNIETLNQVILDGLFNMVMIVEMKDASIDLKQLQDILKEKGEALGMEIRAQHADIFYAMHRVG